MSRPIEIFNIFQKKTKTRVHLHGVGRALDVLSVYDRLGCDVIGLQETRRSGHSARLATWCTAAVSVVTKMVGRKGKVE